MSKVAKLAVFTAATLLLVLGSCEWLLKLDRVPPYCSVLSPIDSSSVSGTVTIQAEATDSIGVSRVDFYVDNSFLGVDSVAPFAAAWQTDSIAEGTWHAIFCAAFDLAGNVGCSDTIHVRVARPEQRSIYHGVIELRTGQRFDIGFDARQGDTLAGEARVASNGVVSRFLWLDRDNYRLYLQQQSFTALYQVSNVAEFSMIQSVPRTDSFYVVFENSTGYTQTYWARFKLE